MTSSLELTRALRKDGLVQSLAANFLGLIVMPTEQCNFRCVYCYEDFDHGRMEPSVVRGLERLLTRRAPELDHLDLSWFGGEPLLAADIVEEVQAHACALAARYPRIFLTASITTNGYLLDPARFARLVSLRLRNYQVSFDGPPDLHDRKRVRAGGQPTFHRIWSNLEAARDLEGDFEFLVRVHVDRDNRDAIPEFVERYRESFGADRRFKLFLRALSRLGGPNDASLAILEGDDSDRTIEAARRDAASRGVALYAPGAEDAVCYASKANTFVVRSDGTLGKCTIALSSPRNRVGRLLEDGRVEIQADKVAGWIRGLWSGDDAELRCPMVGFADPAGPQASRLLTIGPGNATG